MLGERYSFGKTWVASASSKLTDRRATSSPGSNAVSLERKKITGWGSYTARGGQEIKP